MFEKYIVYIAWILFMWSAMSTVVEYIRLVNEKAMHLHKEASANL